MTKRKCLVLIPGIPFPPVDGHKLKIYNLIKILSSYFDLHIVTISRQVPDPDSLNFIRDHCYRYRHFKLGRIRSLFRVFKGLFSSIPVQVAYFTSSRIKRYIRLNSADDEYVVLNLVRTAEYLNELDNKKVVFDMVDLLSKSYLKSSTSTSSVIFKLIYKIESARLVNYEKDRVSRCALTLCVNKEDSIMLQLFGNSLWIPNGVKPELFTYQKKDARYENYIAFFGAMFYQPNIDAVIWFEKEVLKHLDRDIIFAIIGPKPPIQIQNLSKKYSNVIVTGFLVDPYIILNSCFAIVAPMQNGGGIQNKILETMGMGKVNVLTSYGAAPVIGAQDKLHFFVEDDPRSMAERINDLYFNKQRYYNIGQNARQFIKDNYTWESYENRLISALARI